MTAFEHLCDLLMASPLHRKWTLEHIVEVFTPPLMLGQCYVRSDGTKLTAFCAWALMSDEHSAIYAETHRIKREYWNSGNNLWMAEVVAPYGGAFSICRELNRHFARNGYVLARWMRPKDKNQRIHSVINTSITRKDLAA